jgi:spermidine synthase
MINDAPKNYYDLIVIDIFNQPKRKNSLNSEIFLEKCKKRLKQRDSVLIKRGGFTDTDAETLENARSNKKNALIKNRDLQDALSSVFKYTQTFHINTYKPVTYNICSNNIDVKEYTYTDDRLV